jgi:hypothetical protein
MVLCKASFLSLEMMKPDHCIMRKANLCRQDLGI